MALVRNGKLFGRIHYAFVIMVCCCFVQAFGMGLILNCGSLFYVPVCEDLGFLRSEISTYMTGYFIGTTLVTPVAGKLLSKYDTRAGDVGGHRGAVGRRRGHEHLPRDMAVAGVGLSGGGRGRGHLRAALRVADRQLVRQAPRVRLRHRHGVLGHFGGRVLAGDQLHHSDGGMAVGLCVRGRGGARRHSAVQPDHAQEAHGLGNCALRVCGKRRGGGGFPLCAGFR